MDQSRKRRLNNRKTGLSQCKVARNEEPEEVCESRDVTDATGSDRHFSTIRASSPQSDSASQEQHAACIQKPEDDAEKTLIITCNKEQGGTRTLGRRKGLRRKRDAVSEVEAQQKEAEDEIQPEVEIDRELDRELENKSRQHNLTSANVRSIIHEVITNEHVVAMMKAAISDTEPIPIFEPKMTRSKLKEVVEKGVVIPAWNISPIKKPSKKGPQFVDIPLEEEDSSDEEYRPDEEEEDETAEETLLESDFENSSSSPRCSRVNLHRSSSEHEEDGASSSRPNLRRSRHLTVAVTPMGPPPPPPAPSRAPPDCSFLEKLHAVDEELAIGPDCIESYQSLSSANGEESLISFRTRSKRPLRNVPLGRLEAELRAPDITPDMYEFGSTPEDREWTQWLQGLMSSDMENEEEGDDEDDPEYNFLAEIDEPDVEDYRNDKAVRITKKEVNDLMEELFDTFQDELGSQEEEGHEEEEEKEEDESPLQEPPGVMENIQYEDPLADVLKQRYRTVREQLAAVKKRKALLESKGVSVPPPCPQRPSSPITSMTMNTAQKLQLQQQIQQHVQLLTQVNMLCCSVKGLETEASTSRQFLLELQMFSQHGDQSCGPVEHGFTSIFKACNLQSAISLLEELDQSPKGDPTVSSPCFPGCQFPAPLAWLMVTRPVFLYPELLPTIQLRPSRFKGPFSPAEDCLVVLGHKHLRSTLNPLQMTCRYLLAARSFISLNSHIRDVCHKPFPNVIKTYFVTRKCPPMPLACKRVSPSDQRPPVEREKSLMPNWLSKNLKCIYEHVRMFNQPSGNSQTANPAEEATESPGPEVHCSLSPGMRYPPSLPEDLAQTLESSPGSCKKKNDKTAKSTKPLKPPPSAEELEVFLNQLPTLLPKTITVPSPSLSNPSHLALVLRPEPNPCVPGNGAMNGPFIVSNMSNMPPMGQNPGGAVVTLPLAPVAPELSSSRTVPVKNAVGTPMGVSGSPQRAQVGATRGDVIITLPAALAPELNTCSSQHIAVNQTAQIVSSNVEPRGSNLIITLQPSLIPNILKCPTTIIKASSTPSAKDRVSQHCGTLLKVVQRGSGGLAQIHQKPLNQFLLLPPGYVLASSSLKIAGQDQTLKHSSALNSKEMKLRKQQRTPDTFQSSHGPQGDPPKMTSVHDAPTECLQETTAAEEELSSDDGVLIENEVEEYGEKDPRELFLTLSESSGSPTPSIDGEDTDMEIVLGRREKLEEQNTKERQSSNRLTGKEEKTGGGVSDVLFAPELQKTIEKFSHLATKMRSEKEGSSDDGKSNHQPAGSVESPLVIYDNASDDDPYRDAKDVAFAQAYLEKVYEVLQMVPGKVDEFLCVLSEFEKDPKSRTSLELLTRLKPVLSDWPELLRDFAAFLHPDQARECGLLAEQQAFERSRRFLRQLECTFGEQSDLYRKVVHILQGGPSQDLPDFKEMKAQITLLFRDHTDLLEEFWEFFKQLYPQVQDEDHADNVETIRGLERNHACQPIRTVLPDKKMEPVKTTIKHRRKRDKHVQMAETKKNKAKKHSVATESKKDAAESSSVDREQSSFNTTGSSVCAKNISRTPNGKKVVLWTREADRVILTTCQQRGAKPATFHAIAAQLGNKTANEVLERFQDLIKLFHKSSKLHHTSQSDTEIQSGTIEDEPD
ncbi:GON-4-like protein isoform X2 [Onychostoma macrolepis]|uniref:GON-4-like protein isoform X2 n=1 Tax=Onychostoma macrolepis TaxID=369639 RepID=UPI00272C7E7F|nr:GON-4-like protein isoform X2 [Onychostoma macrolepis]